MWPQGWDRVPTGNQSCHRSPCPPQSFRSLLAAAATPLMGTWSEDQMLLYSSQGTSPSGCSVSHSLLSCSLRGEEGPLPRSHWGEEAQLQPP